MTLPWSNIEYLCGIILKIKSDAPILYSLTTSVYFAIQSTGDRLLQLLVW